MKVSQGEFEKLAVAELDMLYRVARRLAGQPAAAEDLVQETYMRALRARGDFELKEFGIRPWLLRIMHNLHSSRAAREARQPRAVDDGFLERSGPTADMQWPDRFEGMDEHLVRAFDQLPAEYQTVMMLWALEEMSYKEIAHAVGVPIGTVMSRLHRGRQRLSNLLHDYAQQEGIIRE